MNKPCIFCGHALEIVDRVGMRDECPHCHRDLHACLQCQFYDEFAHHECREPQAEYVSDKEKANFCDYFVFGSAKSVRGDKTAEAKAKLEDLFKK